MDATDLYTVADRVAANAEMLRGRARLLAAHGDQLRWQSTGARSFRARLDAIVAALHRSADRGVTVAAAVRSVAAQLRSAR